MRETCHERELVGKRLEGPGLSSISEKSATDQDSCQEIGSQGTVHIEYDEANGDKGCIGPGAFNRPERTRPSRKRKHQETMNTSLLHYQQFKGGQKREKDSFFTQDLTHLQDASAWTKARASLSLHKKKIDHRFCLISSFFLIPENDINLFNLWFGNFFFLFYENQTGLVLLKALRYFTPSLQLFRDYLPNFYLILKSQLSV